MHRTNTLPRFPFVVQCWWVGPIEMDWERFEFQYFLVHSGALRNLRIKLIANDLNSFLALSKDMSTRVPLSRSDRHGVFVKFFQVFARFRKKVFGYDADEEEDAIMVCPDLTFVAAGGCSQ